MNILARVPQVPCAKQPSLHHTLQTPKTQSSPTYAHAHSQKPNQPIPTFTPHDTRPPSKLLISRKNPFPMPRNLLPSSNPHPFPTLHVLHKSSERPDPPRFPHQPTMQADRHHFRAAVDAFLVECVESVFQIGVECVGVREAGRYAEFHIVLVLSEESVGILVVGEVRDCGQLPKIGKYFAELIRPQKKQTHPKPHLIQSIRHTQHLARTRHVLLPITPIGQLIIITVPVP